MDAASGGTGWSELFLERRLLMRMENAAQLMQVTGRAISRWAR